LVLKETKSFEQEGRAMTRTADTSNR